MRKLPCTDEDANPYQPPGIPGTDIQLPRFLLERILFFACWIPICFSIALEVVPYYCYGEAISRLPLAFHVAGGAVLAIFWVWRRRTWRDTKKSLTHHHSAETEKSDNTTFNE
jgi:hypothetical protein